MTDYLIPRDLPLEPGRKLRVTFTVSYELTVDEDLTQGEPASLEQIEEWLGGTHHGLIDDDVLWRALSGNYDRTVVEHEVTLDDRYEGNDDGPVRFEVPWEAKVRAEGRQGEWRSRVWLDEVPSAGALPLGPESNPPVPTVDLNEGFWTAEETMAREG